jgi:hypothetical protein
MVRPCGLPSRLSRVRISSPAPGPRILLGPLVTVGVHSAFEFPQRAVTGEVYPWVDQVLIQCVSAGLLADVRALVPEALRRLPPGRYLVEPLVDDEVLAAEEELGVVQAVREIEAGQSIAWEQVSAELRRLKSE